MCTRKKGKLKRGAPTQLNILTCQLVLITYSIIIKRHSKACEGCPVVRDEIKFKFQL